MFALTFGSLGDFVTVMEIMCKLSRALNDSRGAKAEFQSLIQLLGSLTNSLSIIYQFLTTSFVAPDLQPDLAFLNGVKYHLEASRKLLVDFTIRSKKYTESLCCNGKAAEKGFNIRRELRKISWTLFEAEDAKKVEERLKSHFSAFQVFLEAINIQIQNRAENRTAKDLQHIKLTLEDIYISLRKGDTVPQEMGMTWEGKSEGFGIHLDPALGKAMAIPMFFCRTEESFHYALLSIFGDTPARIPIKNRKYELIDENSGTIIDQYNWDFKVLPYSQIAMNVVLDETLLDYKAFQAAITREWPWCPRCSHKQPYIRRPRGIFVCRLCELTYRKRQCEIDGSLEESSLLHARYGVKDLAILDAQQSIKNLSLDNLVHVPKSIRLGLELPMESDRQSSPASVKIEDIYSLARSPNLFRRITYNLSTAVYPGNSLILPGHSSEETRIPIITAAVNGDEETVRKLLREGHDPSAQDFKGWSALQHSAWHGHEGTVRLLVETGASINAPAAIISGRTALQAACKEGNLAIVNRLLEAGADVNAPAASSFGRTALQAAVAKGHIAVIERLLEVGVDVNAPPANFYGRTALQAAALDGNMAILERLIEAGGDVNTPAARELGMTALQAAAAAGHFAIVKRLLKAGADVDAPPARSLGRSALQAATERGHSRVVELLRAASK